MTKFEMKKLAKELLEKHMGYTVPISKIVPLEFSENALSCDYLLFKLATSEVTYAYRNSALWGKSLVIFKNMECENGMYIFDEYSEKKYAKKKYAKAE